MLRKGDAGGLGEVLVASECAQDAALLFQRGDAHGDPCGIDAHVMVHPYGLPSGLRHQLQPAHDFHRHRQVCETREGGTEAGFVRGSVSRIDMVGPCLAQAQRVLPAAEHVDVLRQDTGDSGQRHRGAADDPPGTAEGPSHLRQGMVQACMQCGRGRHGCTAFRACHCARV